MPPISPVRPHPIIEPMPLPVHPIEIPPDIYLPMNVVDDGDDQFHQKGKWTVVPFAGNMGDFRFASPHKKKTAKAVWKFSDLQNGRYDVYVTWDAYPTLSKNAPFTIMEGSNVLDEVRVDQSKKPYGINFKERQWQRISTVEVGDHSDVLRKIKVRLTNKANSYVVADGVMLRKAGVIERGADLSLSINAPDAASPGDHIKYGLSISNNGPETAKDVGVVLTYETQNLTPDTNSPSWPAKCNVAMPLIYPEPLAADVVCSIGDEPAHTASMMYLPFTVKDYAQCDSVIVTKGRIHAVSPFDPNLTNNDDYRKTEVECGQSSGANLSLAVSYDDRTEPGSDLEYTVFLLNAGPDTAENVRVTVPNPDGRLHFDDEMSDSRCYEYERPIEYDSSAYNSDVEPFYSIWCDIGDMQNDEKTKVLLTFHVDPSSDCTSSIRTTFEADSDTNDPNSGNNFVYSNVDLECSSFPVPEPPIPYHFE